MKDTNNTRPKIIKKEVHNIFVMWVFTPTDKRDPPTQAAFAARHGVSQSTLTRWKNDADFARSIFQLSPSLVAFNWANVLQAVLSDAMEGNMEAVTYLTSLLGIKPIIKQSLDPDSESVKKDTDDSEDDGLVEFNDLVDRMYSN